jgi:hypothetical protein
MGDVADCAARRALESLAAEERRTRVLRRRLCQPALALARQHPASPASLLLRAGAKWAGTLGGHQFLLLVCHRDGRHLEAVGVYPGTLAVRMQGSVTESGRGGTARSGVVQQDAAAMSIVLCAEETLLGGRSDCLRLELALMDNLALEGVYRGPHQAVGLHNHAVRKCAVCRLVPSP